MEDCIKICKTVILTSLPTHFYDDQLFSPRTVSYGEHQLQLVAHTSQHLFLLFFLFSELEFYKFGGTEVISLKRELWVQ